MGVEYSYIENIEEFQINLWECSMYGYYIFISGCILENS